MSNFLIALDADFNRRHEFINSVRSELAPLDGLHTGERSQGDLQVIWSAQTQAPVSQYVDSDSIAILWGDAGLSDTNEQITASGLCDIWSDAKSREHARLNGFFAGIVYRPEVGLIVGCDLLGVFPVYYYCGSDFLLVASSPELFTRHPAFQLKINRVGLVGMLLTMHSFAGETLLNGIKRLAAGHYLIKRPTSGPSEERHYRLPVSTRYFSLPFSAHVDLMDEVFSRQAGWQLTADSECGFLLSGGLDSRLLAGYLARKGLRVNALTLGVAEDIEMQCAVRVAHELNFKHQAIDLPFKDYPAFTDLQVKWEHLANGCNSSMEWGLSAHLEKYGRHVVLGHMLDAVIGTRYINWAYSATEKDMSFENFFSHANAWGFSPQILRELLRPDLFSGMVDDLLERIKEVYESYSDIESQRAWCFNLHHRQRFHVGSSAWACSFGAWPVVPALDDQFLACAGGMPAASIAERRAQTELLCERFPQLAALPLDRNSYHTRPLRPRIRYHLGQALKKPLAPMFNLQKKRERRYYVRTFDINSPGWRAVRHQAEAGRRQLGAVFNPDVLDQLLPGPDTRIELQNEIIDASGLKLLLGLMLWAQRCL